MRTKTFSILTIIALSFFSCIKEFDESTKETSPIDEPELLSSIVLQGSVKDTLGEVISSAKIKVLLKGYEVEAETELSGHFSVEVPAIADNGYIVANQNGFLKKIQTIEVKPETEVQHMDLFMINNDSSSSQSLAIDTDHLLIIRGRAINEENAALEGAVIRAINVNEDALNSVSLQGYTLSDEEGYFEIVGEQVENSTYHQLYLTMPQTCEIGTLLQWADGEHHKNLGDVSVSSYTGQSKYVSIHNKDCSTSDSVKLYANGAWHSGIYFQPPGTALNFTYCGALEERSVYVGLSNTDHSNFNGDFYSINTLPNRVEFDMCTPEGYFMEVSFNGFTHLIKMPYFDTDDLYYKASNGYMSVQFRTKLCTSYNDDGRLVGHSCQIDDLVILNTNLGVSYHKDPDVNMYVHFEELSTTYVEGVLGGDMQINTGNNKPVKIRYRIPI